MFKTIEEFEKAWQQESAKSTQSVMDRLTDESLGQPIAEGHRTLGKIAWHLVTTIPEMMGRTGLKVSSVAEDAPLPESAKDIAAAYKKVSSELLEQVKQWPDEKLAEEDDMYGFKWAKHTTLRILIDHEIHHRGQMTVLMRQAGLTVPGVCGPSKEEWSQFGMEAPEE